MRKVDSDATQGIRSVDEQLVLERNKVWDKKKVKPCRTTQGKGPETMRSGWQMAKAEWMAEGRTDDEEEAALQQDSTQRACNDSLYFSNADLFTQHLKTKTQL